MSLCAFSQQFRSDRMKKSLHFSSSKTQTQDDELNKSQYQNEYINKFIQYISKSPLKQQKKHEDSQPSVILLKNINLKQKNLAEEQQSQNLQDQSQKKQKESSIIQDYIEMKKRQQILQIYMNEQTIMDSVQQKIINPTSKQKNYEETQKSFSDCKQNSKNQNIFQKTHNNSSQNIQLDNVDFYSSCRPVLTEQSSESFRYGNQPNKCLRSIQKYLHQSQQQVIPQDIELEIQKLNQKRNNQENSKNKLVDTSILFNNQALNHLIQPKSAVQSNTKEVKHFNQLLTTSTAAAPKFTFLEKQSTNPNLFKQKDNSQRNLFDIRQTQVLKDKQIINDLQISSSSQLNPTEMYSTQINQSFKTSFTRRNIRSYSQKTEEIPCKNQTMYLRPPYRRYNADQEESLHDSPLNESSIQNTKNTVQQTRKQTINKLVKYFNTIADFKQESLKQIKMNRIESRNFVFSQNNDDVIQSYAQIISKKQLNSSESEELNSIDTTSLNQNEQTFKTHRHNLDYSTELSPIITDFSIDKIDFKSNVLENMIDSTELIESNSTFTSCTVSPKIRPRYSIKNIENEEKEEEEIMKKQQRSSKKTIKTEDSANKRRKLLISSSLAAKDTQKQIKAEQLINSQIFINKSFLQSKVPKRKQKKTNIINQSLEVAADQTKKVVLKKKDNKIKLNPIEQKQNSYIIMPSQQNNNQNISSVLQILKTIS
ncbi:hypothetical protein TTHERM_00646990 (macronuclear) [Tetrahymena thermophila SB210]|uniref:Uncharacterized protein n=1 Tax=Tetrahymena thermophila (strain SB210) TaxID=312017 RepID=I7M4J3_TETTS|nr:hypothetical protein TTHERM_00646990 [Tetrahymena thermophila SB210]EAS07166.2 hypothetical protein TTHERM_00646990 [Tetrahymena thermophila SB210]|eukprot:XP_001027408.2 hypothetical protein TTHERM_00646990 [Tetrahymena thermophila SB210]